jgi:hypothetical protein
MRLSVVLVAAILTSTPVMAQPGSLSSASSGASSATEDDARFELPVSLERIRELLARAPPQPLLRGLDRPPNFRVRIEERRFIADILDNLDIGKVAVPAGGLYGYEQQRQVWNPVDRPLMQPYAAFSQGELAQVAATATLNAVVAKYLLQGIRNINQWQSERGAREEVRRAITEYCAAHPERESIELCTVIR